MGFLQSWMRLGLVIGSNYRRCRCSNLAARGLDIFHMSNILVRNPPTRCLRTATLHDMTCWIMPEFHTAANVKAAKDFAERVAGPADGLIAVSEWTRSDAVRILKLRPERIQVIHSGRGRGILRGRGRRPWRWPVRCTAWTVRTCSMSARSSRARIWTRCWMPGSSLPPSLREEFELILAGPVGWGQTGVVERAAGMAGVRYIRYVPEADLAGHHGGRERIRLSFALRGLRFSGGAGDGGGSAGADIEHLVAAGSHRRRRRCWWIRAARQEIAAGLEKLLSSPSLRKQLSDAGRERAREFHWEACARQSLAYFERVLGRA